MKDKIRIGLIIDEFIVPAWQYNAVREIALSTYAEVSVIIQNESRHPLAASSFSSSIIDIHRKIDALLFSGKNTWQQAADLRQVIVDSSVITAFTTANNDTAVIECDTDKLREFSCDVIINLSDTRPSKSLLAIPAFGVWGFSIQREPGKFLPAGYQEVVKREIVTNSQVLLLKNEPLDDIVLHDSWESTCPFSVNLNGNKTAWRTSYFASVLIENIYRSDYASQEEFIQRSGRPGFNNRAFIQKIPSSAESVSYLIRGLAMLSKQILKKLLYTNDFNWFLRFSSGNSFHPLDDTVESFKSIIPPSDRFWADPFVINENGKNYIFVEEFLFSTNRGHISVIELDSNDNISGRTEIIVNPYHMSYPFVFRHKGDYYMIPESSGNRTVDLYHCTDFPYTWEYVNTIFNDINAVDTTPFFHNNKWWLFTSIDKSDNISGFDTELHIFYSDDILSGNWISHPLNPVVSDARRARPAGAVFYYSDMIIRPSQDCSVRYGRAFNMNRITKLSETEYEEVVIRRVAEPEKSQVKGTHTFNSDSDSVVVDAYRYRRRFQLFR